MKEKKKMKPILMSDLGGSSFFGILSPLSKLAQDSQNNDLGVVAKKEVSFLPRGEADRLAIDREVSTL